MKKLAIAAAVAAAAISLQSNAALYNVSSNVTGNQLFIGGNQDALLSAGGSWSLAIGGTIDITLDGLGGYTVNSSNLTYQGVQTFTAGPLVRLTYDLSQTSDPSNYVNGVGTTFNAGTILIETKTPSDTDFVPYATVDASATPLAFTASPDGGHAGQARAGLLLENGAIAGDGSITVALPGLWSPASFFNPTVENSISGVTLFGNSAGVWAAGDITLTAVPVPAAAWLFGSALMGLAGVARRRKAA